MNKLNKTEYKISYFSGKAALHSTCGFQYQAEIDQCQCLSPYS